MRLDPNAKAEHSGIDANDVPLSASETPRIKFLDEPSYVPLPPGPSLYRVRKLRESLARLCLTTAGWEQTYRYRDAAGYLTYLKFQSEWEQDLKNNLAEMKTIDSELAEQLLREVFSVEELLKYRLSGQSLAAQVQQAMRSFCGLLPGNENWRFFVSGS